MKKTISFILLVGCLVALCSCGFSIPDMSSASKIVYGEKYIFADDTSLPEDEQNYYIFEKGHLTHHYYYHRTSRDSDTGEVFHNIEHYTLTYKYTVMDEGTIAYFFDSIEIHDDDTETKENYGNTKRGLLLFSENVVSTISGALYVRQSYLDEELENFGKKH